MTDPNLSQPILKPKPLNLPKVTVLYGPSGCGHRTLGDAISACDPGMQQVFLDEPAEAVIRTLFIDPYNMPEKPERLPHDAALPLCGSTPLYVNDFMHDLTGFLRQQLGVAARAKLALHHLRNDPFVPERLLFVDCYTFHELNQITEHYGPSNAMTIWLGPLNYPGSPQKRVVMPTSDPIEQMRLLRSELGDLFE